VRERLAVHARRPEGLMPLGVVRVEQRRMCWSNGVRPLPHATCHAAAFCHASTLHVVCHVSHVVGCESRAGPAPPWRGPSPSTHTATVATARAAAACASSCCRRATRCHGSCACQAQENGGWRRAECELPIHTRRGSGPSPVSAHAAATSPLHSILRPCAYAACNMQQQLHHHTATV
jgi:hypothetical protein